MTTLEDLENLAEQCLATAKIVKTYLASNGYQQPTFDQNGPAAYPKMSAEAEFARAQLRHTSKTLYELASGPAEPLCQHAYNSLHDLNAFRYVAYFKIYKSVPHNDIISYGDLATKTGTDKRQLKKVIRQLAMINVFSEPKPGYVSHTASSRLYEQPGPLSWTEFITLDSLPFVVSQIDAIEKWGHGSQEQSQAAPSKSFDDERPMFQLFANHPDTGTRFNNLMTFVSGMDHFAIDHAVAGYDWAAIGNSTSNGLVVDVAGNMGHCSIAFAQANPNLKFIVQDLPTVVARAEDPTTSIVPEALRSQERIEFMVHDFHRAQPVKHADVYFFRMVMHNLADKYAVEVLRNTVSAMKPSSRIVVMDQVLPPPGVMPPVFERVARTQDLQMMLLLNGTQREYAEWEELFTAADPRLKIKSVATPTGSLMSVIEVALTE